MINIKMSPREYSASLRGLPFRKFSRPDKEQATWEAVCGLVAATAPGSKRYVQYHDLYSVEWNKDHYEIVSYWPEREYDWIQRPYTVRTLRKYFYENKLHEIDRGMSYEDLMQSVTERYPSIEIPSKKSFFAQFGIPLVEVE